MLVAKSCSVWCGFMLAMALLRAPQCLMLNRRAGTTGGERSGWLENGISSGKCSLTRVGLMLELHSSSGLPDRDTEGHSVLDFNASKYPC